MGVKIEPVTGSGVTPAWICLVLKPIWIFLAIAS
jgi:hypothetical protein